MMGLGTAGLLLRSGNQIPSRQRHIITLSFDDGFEKSSRKTAELYQKYGLSACLNIIATAHLKDFQLPNEYHRWKVGDFNLWNDLAERGHEIMPHGLKHEDYTKLSFEEAKGSVYKCLDIFTANLKGFVPGKAIFNFPYNASTPELESWIPSLVRAFRTGGDAINHLPFKGQVKLGCTSQGPEMIDDFLQSVISSFLDGPPAWLIFNAHGLDDEGWGPISSSFLDELLDRLVKSGKADFLNITQALDLITL
jgi:peptidoglycan/xylan/chitin deacetylase (PgdA/CDA1 family)